MIPIAQKAIALPRSSGGKVSRRIACDRGPIMPPVTPCKMRKNTSNSRLGAMPHRKEAAVKLATLTNIRRRRPKVLASQPLIGRITAVAAR